MKGGVSPLFTFFQMDETITFKDHNGKVVGVEKVPPRLDDGKYHSYFVTLVMSTEDGLRVYEELIHWPSYHFVCYVCLKHPPDVKSPSFFKVFEVKDCGHVICEECIITETQSLCSSCSSTVQCTSCFKAPRELYFGIRQLVELQDGSYKCITCLNK